ncbi:MAG: DinB family protein [bacterium]|nr:DinB family protein [bacterium]
MKSIHILKQIRKLVYTSIDRMSEEHLLIIPEGRKNNILWNIGHIAVTQQILHYKLSGMDMYLSTDFIDQFKRGSSPSDWSSSPDILHIKELLTELPNKLDEDYSAGKFANYKGYTSSTGVSLQDIEESIAFNNFHEGVHLGIVMSIKKFLA